MTVYRDLYFDSSDGLKLYARDYPGPESTAPVLVCLHGLTRNSRDFATLAESLCGYFRVLVPEARGRGLSAYDPDISHYALMTYVEDLHHLLVQQGVQSCSVVGTSMGGLMTFAYNALHPGMVKRAVINDIGPDIATEGLDRIKRYVGVAGPFADWGEATAYLKGVSGEIFPNYTERQWSAFARQCYTERDGSVVIDYDPKIAEPLEATDSDGEADTLWSLFSALHTVPVLLIRGELSDLLDPACVDRMAAEHPNLSVLEVPGVGHAPMLDEPGVLEQIRAFLVD